MTQKRFTDDGIEDIENQSFTDNLTGKTYWIDHGLDEIIDLLNVLTDDENEKLKKENLNLSEELDYYKAKCASLETGLFQADKENKQLKMGIDSLKLLVKNWEALDEEKDEQIDRQSQALKKLKKENSVFEGKDAKHYQRWVNQIKKYVEEDNPDFTYDDDFIIKIALSYTLQSLRNGESLKRFQWNYKELKE